MRGAVGARHLKYPNRFTIYSIHPIELVVGRLILDISPQVVFKRLPTKPTYQRRTYEYLHEATKFQLIFL